MYAIDVEIYKNYFLLAAKHITTGETLYFEDSPYHRYDFQVLRSLMRNHTTISFNGNNFDVPIIACSVNGWPVTKLKALADKIINSNLPSWKIVKDAEISIPSTWDHIDMFEVSPGRSSLKIYGGRMHMPRLEDLPIEPGATLTRAEMTKIKSYCVNDLDTTIALYNVLEKSIDLRADMSKQYGVDLRSKSDAQVAEEVIRTELERLTGKRYYPPKNPPTRFRYLNPQVVEFQTPALQALFKAILKTPFETSGSGAVATPAFLKKPILIGGREYQAGIGGLHSKESGQMVEACDQYDLLELDVTSYYPSIILQQNLAPESIGKPFLDVYRTLFVNRVAGKRRLKEVEAEILDLENTSDTLDNSKKERLEKLYEERRLLKNNDGIYKLGLNGSFGKLGSKYSAFYAPDLLIQTTVTGQLALLMLIERLHIAGIDVVSANTDGIVVHVAKSDRHKLDEVAWEWMLDTSYGLEETNYRVLASRNVNNYIAVTTDGRIKGKGCFASPGLSKNPDFQIIYDAVAQQVANNIPVEKTIAECRDITKFVSIRRVSGGAIWRDELLGRAVRFYYSTDVPDDESIRYATNTNTVPKSTGARPVMNIPPRFPTDVNFEPYIEAAQKLLVDIGFSQEVTAQTRLL